MTTLPAVDPTTILDPALRAALESACARIAPAWPLDRLIAVNPHWGWVDRPITEAAAELGGVAGIRFHMPRAWVREQLDAGRLSPADLERAREVTGTRRTLRELLDALDGEAPTLPRHPLVTDERDAMHDVRHEATWSDLALQSVARACEAWFDAGQASWHPDRAEGLFGVWRRLARADAAPRLLLDARGFRAAVDELPDSATDLIAEALDTLGIPKAGREAYLLAVLHSVPGWASHCAFRRWEARLRGEDDHVMVELLAARLAWELLLFRTAGGTDLPARFARARRAWQERSGFVAADQEIDWVLQRALELRYHERLAAALARVPTAIPFRSGPAALATTRAQAVFCIDVRSEVLRRHLEDVDPDVRTLGFAGFFGLPIAYAPVAGDARPQLPGLLAPSVVARDAGPAADDARRAAQAESAGLAAWRGLARGVPSTFSFVEATGLSAAFSLLRGDLARAPRHRDALRHGLDADAAAATPVLVARTDGTPLDLEARAGLAASALRGMSLTEGFARLVAFVGHGAAVTNNPQAAGLACGACGGQSGEVNARALAALLNDGAVRGRLAAEGIVIPAETRFVGALHDTVTDGVRWFPEPALLATHADDLAVLRQAFDDAAERSRRERAGALGIPAGNAAAQRGATEDRAADWSEVRPEWALARNAAFIAAPRERTRPLHLDGRTFLHEYRWHEDHGFTALETILTAPVVVAHWINLQYHASTVEPERFGSGDKTLHNVVGGTLGVYEGAGGDLRIGLSRQSVHDGGRFVHEPLRLAVFIEAPAHAIDGVLERHRVVRDLVAHEWIHLYRIAPDGTGVYARRPDGWVRTPGRVA